jgi:hypothetical protein
MIFLSLMLIILTTRKFNQNQQLIYKIMLENQKLFNATINNNEFMIGKNLSMEIFTDYSSVCLKYRHYTQCYELIVQDYSKKYLKLYLSGLSDFIDIIKSDKEITADKIDAEFDKMLINFDKTLFNKEIAISKSGESVITYTRK